MRHFKITSCVGVAVAMTALTACYARITPPGPGPTTTTTEAPTTTTTVSTTPVPVVNAAPNPIPTAWPRNAPPPIPSLTPASTAAPPDDRIADPVNAAAECGGWHQQSNYGDRWSAASTWWAYSCTYTSDTGNPFQGSGGFACVCDGYYEDINTRTDYYVWDGANAVFYGQAYDDWFIDGYNGWSYMQQSLWWDAATAQWYELMPAITSFTPAGGPVGTVVDIQGSNFTGATSVLFDSSIYSSGTFPDYPGIFASYTVDSSSEIHATVPAGATSGLIVVTTPDGAASTQTLFTVTP